MSQTSNQSSNSNRTDSFKSDLGPKKHLNPKIVNLIALVAAIGGGFWYFDASRAQNPVLNSPEDITPEILKGITDGSLHSLTMNFPLSCTKGDEVPEYDHKVVNRSNPFHLANLEKPIREIPFKIIAGPNGTSFDCMFAALSELKAGPVMETRNVTSMKSLFAWNVSLESVPLYDTSNVTDMSYMFQHCEKLEHIPTYNTLNVTDMRGMFARAYALKEVPNFKTPNLKYTKWMFSGAHVIKAIPKFDTSKVEDFDRMFADTWALEKLPLLDTSSAKTMNGTFNKSNLLTQKARSEWENIYDFENDSMRVKTMPVEAHMATAVKVTDNAPSKEAQSQK